MSIESSSLPTLHLDTAPSGILRLGSVLVAAVVAGCLLTAVVKGYALAAAALLVWLCRPDGAVPRVFEIAAERTLHWEDGIWWVSSRGRNRACQLRYAAAALPALIYLEFAPTTREEASRLQGVWIACDSLERDDYRRLRVYATLSRVDT